MKEYTFKAGSYYIGDPCHVIKKENWYSFVDKINDDGLFTPGKANCWVGEYNGHKCFVGRTAFGDGEYVDSKGIPHFVDSGLLAVMPFEALEEYRQLLQKFDEDFTIFYFPGVFIIGEDLVIDTSN